jgi:hypothetical protein
VKLFWIVAISILIILVLGAGTFFILEKNTEIKPITASLDSMNSSGETGTVTIENVAGLAAILINLNNSPDEVLQPSKIYKGSCENTGSLMYTLTTPDAGQSETDLNITLAQFRKEMPMTLKIFNSIDANSPIALCGNIK